MTSSPTFQIRVEDKIRSIPADDWDSCANALRAIPESKCQVPESKSEVLESKHEEAFSDTYNPFVQHAFLTSLEESGSASAKTGWLPQHLVLEDEKHRVLAVAPCYLKNHSRGEYVFDHGWADAFERAGGHYYPKLQVSVPFTPVTGPRLLVGSNVDAESGRAALIGGMVELAKLRKASSVHVTFADRTDFDAMTDAGMLARTDRQFHWHNRGYKTFEDFLSALSSNKRKTIRRERKEALASGIEIVRLSGTDLTEEIWDRFFGFYMDTGERKWGSPYLTRQFFSLVSETMRERILLIMAKRNGEYIAGAMNFLGDGTIYGRYWGAAEHQAFLHFEVCYYQAIEYAIERGLRSVEAGAQGEHKLLRGYVPVQTCSAHYIANPSFRRAVADYLDRERQYTEAEIEHLAEAAPYRRASGT